MDHLKGIIAVSEDAMISVIEDIIKSSGIAEGAPKEKTSDLFDFIIDKSVKFGIFPVINLYEEIAKSKFLGKDVADKIILKNTPFRENISHSLILFSRSGNKPTNARKTIRVIAQFPYKAWEILQERFSGREVIFIDNENEETEKADKKVIEIHRIEGEVIDEFGKGEYDLGFGVTYQDDNLKGLDIIEKIEPHIVLVSLKKNTEIDNTVKLLESAIEAKRVCELNVCIPKERMGDAEEILTGYNIRKSEGSADYKWIIVVVPISEKNNLIKLLEIVGAVEINTNPVSGHKKCNGKT